MSTSAMNHFERWMQTNDLKLPQVKVEEVPRWVGLGLKTEEEYRQSAWAPDGSCSACDNCLWHVWDNSKRLPVHCRGKLQLHSI